jgi:hypothetical protein
MGTVQLFGFFLSLVGTVAKIFLPPVLILANAT